MSEGMETYRVDYDGFEGTIQGRYTTREGKPGIVLQQVGTKVVHVYGENRLDPAPGGVSAGMTDEAVEKLHSVWNLLTNIRSLADRTDEVRHRAEVARDLIESLLPETTAKRQGVEND